MQIDQEKLLQTNMRLRTMIFRDFKQRKNMELIKVNFS